VAGREIKLPREECVLLTIEKNIKSRGKTYGKRRKERNFLSKKRGKIQDRQSEMGKRKPRKNNKVLLYGGNRETENA